MQNAPLVPKENPTLKTGTATTLRFSCAGSADKRSAGGYVEILCVTEGMLRLTLDSKTQILTAGHIAVIHPYDEIGFESLCDTHYQHFIFDSPRYFDEIGIPALFRFRSFIEPDTRLTRLCLDIEEEYVHQSMFHEKMLIALTSQLVIYLYRHYGSEKNAPGAERLLGKQKIVREALAYIYENCQNGLSTRDIAASVCVSTAYLCRCFKEVCGISPLDFSERVRCRKAMEDLSLGTLSVTAVAEKYRFSSLSYFNRRYKKYCGVNPASTLAEARQRHAVKQPR